MDRFSDRNKHKSEINDDKGSLDVQLETRFALLGAYQAQHLKQTTNLSLFFISILSLLFEFDSSQIHDIETDEYLKKRISAHIENNNNEIDIDDFMDVIFGSGHYEKLYNNREETNIQANSKSNRSSESKNKKDGLLDALRMIKQDKCPRCGARKTSIEVFSGVQMTLKCEQCGTNISACTGVLPIEDLNSK